MLYLGDQVMSYSVIIRPLLYYDVMFWHSNAILSQYKAWLDVKVPYPNFIEVYIQIP